MTKYGNQNFNDKKSEKARLTDQSAYSQILSRLTESQSASVFRKMVSQSILRKDKMANCYIISINESKQSLCLNEAHYEYNKDK